MEQTNTAKNFVFQLGSLITLYISLGALLALLFGIINLAYPDDAESYWRIESATGAIRGAIAMLVVFFPAYLVLTRKVNSIRRRESGTYLTLTKWLIYLSLLVGGGVLLGDIVAIINAFLNGELAIRFGLKALSVFLVVGSAFLYYLMDAHGFWQQHEKKSIQYGGAAAFVVLIFVIIGFRYIETPAEVRERRIDDRQIQDLQIIQSQIENYYAINNQYPESIDDVFEGISAPIAPEGRKSYSYDVIENGFNLCAEFKHPSQNITAQRPILDTGSVIKNPHNWDHGEGNWCFTRIVN